MSCKRTGNTHHADSRERTLDCNSNEEAVVLHSLTTPKPGHNADTTDEKVLLGDTESEWITEVVYEGTLVLEKREPRIHLMDPIFPILYGLVRYTDFHGSQNRKQKEADHIQ